MSNNIILKKSSVGDKVPLSSDLEHGELALNFTDGNLFYKNNSNVVTTIASNKFVSVTGNVTGGNIVTVGTVSATGNVTGNYFVGNGAFLTGIGGSGVLISTVDDFVGDGSTLAFTLSTVPVNENLTTVNISGVCQLRSAYSVVGDVLTFSSAPPDGADIEVTTLSGSLMTLANLTNGTTTIDIPVANGSAIISVGGTSNVMVVASTGVNVTGTLSATGNITGNYFIGNGSQLTGLPEGYGNADVAAYLPTYTGNLASLAGNVTTTANISANYVLGNGSQLTGLPEQYGNANVAAYLPTYTGNLASLQGNVITTANITGNYILGNGLGLTAITGANVTGQVGNALVAGTVYTAAQPNITSVGTLSSVSVTGNVTAGNLSGTSIVGTLTTAAQTNITSVGTLSALSVTGNVTAGNFVGTLNGSGANVSSIDATNISSGTLVQARLANANVVLGSTALTLGTTTTTIAGLTSVTSTTFVGALTGAATTAGTVTTAAQPNITSVGTLTSISVTGNTTSGNFVTSGLVNTGTLQTSGNAIVGGNLIVNGNTISVNVTNLNVQDPIIGLGRAANNAPLTTNDGKDRGTEMWYYDTAERAAFVGYDNSTGKLIAAANVSIADEIVTINNYGTFVAGAVESTTVSATGNITAGNVAGTTGAFTTVTGNANATSLTSGTVPSARLSGSYTINISGAATTAGTVTTAAQPNITSVGTLTALSVTGNTTSGNFVGTLNGSGANVTSISATNISSGTLAQARLANAAVTLGSTALTLGATVTTVAGLSSVTSTTFVGALTGAATTAGTVTTAAQPNITSVGTLTALSVTGNVTGGNLLGTIRTAAQPNITSVGTLTSLSVTGNVTGGNVSTAGLITATGNITGGNLRTSGVTITTNTVSATGNVNGGNLVTAGLITATGNITGGNISTAGQVSATGNITGGNLVISNADASIGSVSTTAGWYYETSFSVSAQESEPRGVFFKPDGTRMYVAGNSGNDILQYDLGTAWDVSTATYSNAFVVSSQGTTPYDVHFKSDGTVMYVLDGSNDDIDQYTLSSAWDIGSASFASIQFSVSGNETSPTGFWFRPDGTQLFVTGSSGDDVNEYNLGTAWNVSTATFVRVSASLAAFETAPEGLAFSSDGTKMWIVGSTYNRITQFDLSTPWNVSTLSYNSQLPIYGSGPYAIGGASGLYVNESAGVAYVSDYDNDRVFQYATDTPTGQFYGPQWTTETDFNVGNNLSVNNNFNASGSTRLVGAVTAATSISSPNHAATSSSGTTSLITGTTTGTLNFATGITTGTLNQMTAQTTGNFILGGTGATGAINIGRSTANQSIVIGNGVTASGSVKTVNIGTLGASGSNTNVTIGSATAGAVTTTTIYGNVTAGNLITAGLVSATGNITGGNVSGTTGAFTTVTGTVTTAAQPNITSVGTLTSLSVTGNVTGGNLLGTIRTAAQTSITSVGTLTSLSVTGNVTGGNLVTAGLASLSSITKTGTNGVGNIGASGSTFNTVFAKATSAQYADLAEIYKSDSDYAPGTVVSFGGTQEITASTQYADTALAGVISTNPAYLMNSSTVGQPVALQGRVPCRVIGNISRGDLITSSKQTGVATKLAPSDWQPGTVIGKALENYNSNTEGVIEVVVGRI